MSRLATRPRIGRFLAAATLLLVGACGESDFSGPTTALGGVPPEAPSGPTTPPSDTSKPPTAPAKIDYVYLADADGTVRGRLTEGTWPSWSPDGRSLLFTRNGRVHAIDANSSNEKDLGLGAWPAWSPDGSRIAFVPYVAGYSVQSWQIQVMRPDGSGARPLAEPKHVDVYSLAWAPDGASIAFFAENIEILAKIFLVSADGTGERPLTAPTPGSDLTLEWAPAWSPDGSRLVYAYGDYFTGEGGLATIDRDGGNSRILDAGPDASHASRPAWSPDGQSITFGSRDGSIMIVPSSGGSPRRLILEGRDAAWSPDGKRIAFVRTVER